MKIYQVKVIAYAPAPRQSDHRIKANQAHIAVTRAMRDAKKNYPRKKITQWGVAITVIGAEVSGGEKVNCWD